MKHSLRFEKCKRALRRFNTLRSITLLVMASLLTIAFAMSATQEGRAYYPEEAHAPLIDKALEGYQLVDGNVVAELIEAGLLAEDQDPDNVVAELIKAGVIAEDNSEDCVYDCDELFWLASNCKFSSHFWDIDNGGPWAKVEAVDDELPWPLTCSSNCTKNSLFKAIALTAKALSAYRQGNYAESYTYLGHIAHLLQDQSVPAHAHEHNHWEKRVIGINLEFYDYYEKLIQPNYYSWDGNPEYNLHGASTPVGLIEFPINFCEEFSKDLMWQQMWDLQFEWKNYLSNTSETPWDENPPCPNCVSMQWNEDGKAIEPCSNTYGLGLAKIAYLMYTTNQYADFWMSCHPDGWGGYDCFNGDTDVPYFESWIDYSELLENDISSDSWFDVDLQGHYNYRYAMRATATLFQVFEEMTKPTLPTPPEAVADAYVTDEDTLLSVDPAGVLTNDTDVDGDLLTAILDTDVSNGTLTLNTNGAFTYTPTANFNGTDSFTYHAEDGQANSNTAMVTITVIAVNDAPVIENTSNSGPIQEGGSATITVSAYDVDGGILSYRFDCDNDGTFEVGPQSSKSSSCGYADDGNFTVNVLVEDDDGGSATNSTVVTVNNVAPTVTLLGLDSVDEGQTKTYSYTVSDPGADTFTLDNESCGTAGMLSNPNFSSATGAGSFDCTYPDGLATSIVSVTVSDDDGGSGSNSLMVTVSNVEPTLGEITPTPLDPVVVAGTSVDFNAPFSDPAGDQDNPYNCAFDWDGDDTVDENISATYGRCNASHTYPSAGIYTVKLTVTDKNGGISNGSIFAYVVVYDPSAGFVTGGGWIYSEAGAYIPGPQLEGKATFGFVSRYQKNATVPSGSTEFQFHAAGMDFHSDSYEWLVVTGSNYAKFKGVGTLNGIEYKFMLWAGDGTGTDGSDTFRIKIWEEVEGVESVIYDNGMDQEIGGGNIVVQSGK